MKNYLALILSLILCSCGGGHSGFSIHAYTGHPEMSLRGKPVTDGGANGADALDDIAGITATAALVGPDGGISFPAGSYIIGDNLALACVVSIEPGAMLTIAAGKTVSFNHGVYAGVYRIFAGTGAVTINPAFTSTGFPEWWGAVANTGADCLAGMQSCIAACPITQLQAADYYVSTSLIVTMSRRTIQGVHGQFGAVGDGATRIVVYGGSAHTLIVQGPNSTIGNYITQFYLRDVELTRTEAPVPVAAGNEASSPSGLWMKWCIFSYIDRVRCSEHQVGFSLQGTVQTHLSNTYSIRSLAGTGIHTANDTWWGYWLNGSNDIGAAGGNASTYLTDIGGGNASTALVSSVGLRLDHGFVDTFVLRPEFACCTDGIKITGSAPDGPTLQKTGNVDLRIVDAVIDGFLSTGITIAQTSGWSSIDISGGYAAPAGTGSPIACIYAPSCAGMINISHFQGVCWPGSTNIFGLYATDSAGITCRDNQWLDSQRPVALVNCTQCAVSDQIRNMGQNAAEGAVYLSGCSRCVIAPSVSASTTYFPKGIEMAGSANAYCELNLSGIAPSSISGGSANKLVSNGVQITSAGAFGTNLATGVMQ